MDLNSRPIRTDGILVERTPNELLAFSDVTGEAHALNEAAASQAVASVKAKPASITILATTGFRH